MATKIGGGWKGGGQQYLDFRPAVLDTNATFLFIFIHICQFNKLKKLNVGHFFLFVFVKFRNS